MKWHKEKCLQLCFYYCQKLHSEPMSENVTKNSSNSTILVGKTAENNGSHFKLTGSIK